MLWFDVGNGRYTTQQNREQQGRQLWFDVGNGRYTTCTGTNAATVWCGLM